MIAINLLPRHLRPVKRTPIPHILSILVLLAAIGGMAFILITVKAQVFVVRSQLDGVQQELAALQDVVDEHNQLIEDKARLASKIEAIEDIARDRIIWSRQLYNLSRLAPDNLWFREIGVATKRVQRTENVLNADGSVALDPTTNRPRTRPVTVDIPVLRVSGYVIETPDGRLDTGTFARAAEQDEEFASLFQIEQPRVVDTTYEGHKVREFTFEFVIRRGGEAQ